MLCKDCEHFKITAKPMMPYDSGHAHCRKYDLYVDFIDKRKFKWLSCDDRPKGADGKEQVDAKENTIRNKGVW